MKNENFLEKLSIFGQIKKAVGLAKKYHAGQVRKGPDGEAYFNHPRRVCKCYLKYKNKSLSGLVGSLCHDLVEDTPLSLEDLGDIFGEQVRQIVLDLTKPDHFSSDEYAAKINNWDLESKKIKLCDIEDNIRSCRLIHREQRMPMLIRWRKYLNQLETLSSVGLPEEKEFVQKWDAVNNLHAEEWKRLTAGSA